MTLQCSLSSVKGMGIFLSETMARIKTHLPKIDGECLFRHVCGIPQCLLSLLLSSFFKTKTRTDNENFIVKTNFG